MQEQIERWELRSGTWVRDLASEQWRLASMSDGTAVDARLPTQDVGRLVGASRDSASGAWFPPDFNYAQNTGAPLRVTIPPLDSPWAPPFGASALSSAKPLARGLRQTPLPLALARSESLTAESAPDRTLPPLPPGQYHFVVDKFGLACPTLLAVEPEQGHLLMLLPESKDWVALERTADGANWAQRLRNPRGWRMELVHAGAHAIAYCPSATGLAAITPNLIGLSYTVEHAGDGPALGGPVAWGGEIWLPMLGKGHVVHLVGKPHGAARHIVLPTHVPAPQHGFEAPVFDDVQVNWPCDEGQLVLRIDSDGDKQADWIRWPDGVQPLFAPGCPYLSPTGSFWQLCRTGDRGFESVQMGRSTPEAAPLETPRLCTGHISYNGTLRVDGEPWRAPRAVQDDTGTEVVVPLLESGHDGAVIGLRMDAPHGVPALLHARGDKRRAVLQVQAQGRPAVSFGTLDVRRPWLASLFVYDAHLWVDHPELPQPLGWKLGFHAR